ncbi:phytoene desaturase family protein [soil metagenome]
MPQDKIVVIGSGMGGLACAIDLASAGYSVTVVEKGQSPGGKMRQVPVGNAHIDAGPTILTMRWVFDSLFEDAGEALDGHITLHRADVLARHAWNARDRLDLFADVDRSADAIGDLAGAAEARGYRAFHAEAKDIYLTLRDTFLTRETCGLLGLSWRVALQNPPALLRLRPYETLWQALGDHFKDPRLRQLFGRYATYCGASPFAAPATLMLVAHVEQEGVWLVEGDMRKLADALAALAASRTAAFRYGAAVERIAVENGRAAGVVLATGERIEADAVIVTADAAALQGGAFGEGAAQAVPARSPERSLSAVTWSSVARTSGFPLARHNVFFSSDYEREFDDLIGRRTLPEEPTIYVCAQDRDDRGEGADDTERLFTLMNAPADGDRRTLDQRELAACETRVLDHLRRCGLEISPASEPSVVTTPTDFEAMFPGTGGALYGPAMHGWAAAFRRPGARTRTPGLYLAGGSAHPGAGVPMAALSGRLAARRLMRDRASTSPFRRAAIAGGTSTR